MDGTEFALLNRTYYLLYQIMPLNQSKLLPILLLAGGLAFGRSAIDGLDPIRLDGGTQLPGPGPSGSGGQFTAEGARDALQRAEENTKLIQSKFQFQSIPEAEPILQALQNELTQARAELVAGNYQGVFALCFQTESQIALLNTMGTNNFTQHTSGTDAEQLIHDQKAKAEWDLQGTTEHFELVARKLQESKSPNVPQLIEKGRYILDLAKQQISENHFAAVRPLLGQVEALGIELGRVTENIGSLDNHGLPATTQDSHKNQQPTASSALAQATEIYNRVHDRVARLSDQNKPKDDPKSAALFSRILDLLEKCREALANGQADAAKELALQSETLLTEWHQGQDGVGGTPKGLSGSSLERLKVKLDRATEIVAAAKNEKASRIMEKGMDHYERAERGQSEGQSARAQVEMDIALKLAAKAVDIARAGQGR